MSVMNSRRRAERRRRAATLPEQCRRIGTTTAKRTCPGARPWDMAESDATDMSRGQARGHVEMGLRADADYRPADVLAAERRVEDGVELVERHLADELVEVARLQVAAEPPPD